MSDSMQNVLGQAGAAIRTPVDGQRSEMSPDSMAHAMTGDEIAKSGSVLEKALFGQNRRTL